MWWYKVIIVSAFSLSKRDKDRKRERQIEGEWEREELDNSIVIQCHLLSFERAISDSNVYFGHWDSDYN